MAMATACFGRRLFAGSNGFRGCRTASVTASRNPVSLCWRIIDTRRSYIWLTVWYSGSIGLAPEKLQHQGGGQIPRMIDWEHNLQDGGLRSLRIRLRPWEFERQNAETGFAWSHFRNSRLGMRDLDRNGCVIGFQTRGDLDAQLRVLERPQRPIESQAAQRHRARLAGAKRVTRTVLDCIADEYLVLPAIDVPDEHAQTRLRRHRYAHQSNWRAVQQIG